MARKSQKPEDEASFGEILESRDPDMRESFFKGEAPEQSEAKGSDRVQDFFKNLSDNYLFRTKKSVAITVAIVTFALTMGLSSLWAPNSLDTTTLAAKISGGVALTEAQLKDVVKQIDQKVYWSGPMGGAKYTINAQNFNSIYVRYLTNGKGISDQSPKYRVIATYKEANGYESTLSAGNQTDGMSFTNPNGSAIYYNKQIPTNVYLAFQNEPYQIEVFDPDAATALNLAKTDGAIRLVQ